MCQKLLKIYDVSSLCRPHCYALFQKVKCVLFSSATDYSKMFSLSSEQKLSVLQHIILKIDEIKLVG